MKKILAVAAGLFILAGALPGSLRAQNRVESEEIEMIRQGLSFYPTAPAMTAFEARPSWGFSFSRAALARDKALEDIAANIPVLLILRGDFGESSLLEWAIPVAEKLPTQPVAVIQLLTNKEDYIGYVCPMMFFEDSLAYYEHKLRYKLWIQRSIAALEAFTMTDKKAEKTRRHCLGRIKKELTLVKDW